MGALAEDHQHGRRPGRIDQSHLLNIFIAQPTYGKITSMQLHSWEKGLKTGMYYLRTRAAEKAIQFTVNKSKLMNQNSTGSKDTPTKKVPTKEICSRENKDACMMCSG